jgi:hypothetical protein
MRRIVLAVVLSLLISPLPLVGQVSEPGAASSLLKSKRISRVLKDAQIGVPPIHIKEFEGGSAYSGTTDFYKGEIIVRVNGSLPRPTAQNNLVHELFHIILLKEGFRYAAASKKFNSPGDVGRLYTAAGTALTSCYVDPLIDRRMAKRGFKPDLVIHITASGLAHAQSSEILRESRLDHWTDYAAMQLYCLSLRPGKFKMANVEKAWAVNPEIVETERRLRKRLPGGCDTPAVCFESMKALRKATGFETDIFLMNPQTREYE